MKLNAPVLYETHSHTPLCRHAVGLPQEYAQVAEDRNLKGLLITCHNPMPDKYSAPYRMTMDELDRYVEMVADARDEFEGRVHIRLGLESEYFPGIEPFIEKLHASKPFKFILGSVHPQVREYRERFYKGSVLAYQQTYYEHLALSAESGLYDCVAHPDLIKHFFPSEWNIDRLQPDIEKSFDRIARTGVPLELNTSGLRRALHEMDPGPRILKMASERQIPIIIGADAHAPERTGADFDRALRALQTAGYRNTSMILERKKRIDIPIELALATVSAPVRKDVENVGTDAVH